MMLRYGSERCKVSTVIYHMRNSRSNGAAHTHVFRLRNFLRTMSLRMSEGLKENATVTPALVYLVSKKSQARP